MFRFVARRLLSIIIIAVAITFTSILLMHIAGTQAAPPKEPVYLWDTIRHVTSATGRYLWTLAHGDLGMSSISGPPTPISTVVARTYPKSMALLLLALLLATAAGVPLGTIAAVKRHSRFSVGLVSLSLLGISAPSFFVAMLLQILLIRLYQGTGVKPLPMGGFGWDRHLVMPALVLAARPIANIARLTHITLSDVLEEDYIRTARAKGLTRLVVLNRHAFSNALIPILTTLGVSIRHSLSVLPVVEFFFSWPGIGLRLLKALWAYDATTVTTLVLCLALTFVFINFGLELLYRRLDPKLRLAGVSP